MNDTPTGQNDKPPANPAPENTGEDETILVGRDAIRAAWAAAERAKAE